MLGLGMDDWLAGWLAGGQIESRPSHYSVINSGATRRCE